MNRSAQQPSPRRLYKDSGNRALCGVCAGIADYFGADVAMVRIFTVISQVMFPVTILVYMALCFILPSKPEALYRDEREEEFWQSIRVSPAATATSVRHRFRSLETRLQRMERYVTSRNFGLDREFRDLEKD
jgi:phage shock protein C